MDTVYLANPLGFSTLAQSGLSQIFNLLKTKFRVIEPFSTDNSLGDQISTYQSELFNPASSYSFLQIKSKLNEINTQIGRINMESISKSNLIFAILDGVDIDSGVAAEIGYGFGIHKPIFGFRSDFRLTGDNYGSEINLQVEYFIHASGGQIFHTFAEIEVWLENDNNRHNKAF